MDWLTILRQRYATHRARIEEIQTRAINDGQRELTDDEVRQVTEAGEAAAALVPQIEAEVARLEQVRSVDAAAARVAADQAEEDADEDQADDRQVRGEPLGGTRSATRTQDRDPGHYRRGGEHAFFADLYRSSQRLDDGEAAQRLAEHARALTTGGEGPGLVPPVWLVEEYEKKARFGRALANAVRNIPLSNPSPITLPGQTAGTDAVVGEQSAENDAVTSTDAYDSATVTVTPKPTAGAQLFSRQMFDMSNPAIDELVYGDLLAVYDDKVEAKVCAAVVAAAGSAVTTFATNAAFAGTAPATPGLDALVDAAIAVRTARKLPANAHVMGVARWGILKKLRDTTGRPLLPSAQHGPYNVQGLGEIMADGEHEGIPIIVSDGISTGSFPEDIATLRLQDTILWESSMMRFRFEEVSGPQSIKVGIWAYTACVVRQAALSVRRTRITAAS
ncbi:MAG: phage major capsid protein [Burkholderiales bacterium]